MFRIKSIYLKTWQEECEMQQGAQNEQTSAEVKWGVVVSCAREHGTCKNVRSA